MVTIMDYFCLTSVITQSNIMAKCAISEVSRDLCKRALLDASSIVRAYRFYIQKGLIRPLSSDTEAT